MIFAFYLNLTDWDFMSASYNIVGLRNYFSLLQNPAFYWTFRNTLLPPDYWQTLGAKIWDETKLINLKHGFERRDDYLPERFVKEPLPDGPASGHYISEADMDKMLDDYYRLRGWDKEGRLDT